MTCIRQFRAIFGALVFCAALQTSMRAAGSFDYETELRPILAQQPEILRLLERSFDFEPSGSANRIGNNVNPKLGGKRLGPYHIRAKLKCASRDRWREIIVYTEHVFRDEAGNTTSVENSVSVAETMTIVEIVTTRKNGS